MTIDRDQYCAYLALNGRSDATIRVYAALAQRWVDWAVANNRDPWCPDPLSVRAWSKTLAQSRATLGQARAALSAWCQALDVSDVSDVITLPRAPSTVQPRLNVEQTVRLLQAAEGCGIKGLAVIVAVYTAGRRSEVCSLAWDRVDFDSAQVTLVRPKNRDELTLPMHPNLADALHRRWVAGEQWVFAGKYGGHVAPATVWQWAKDVAEVAGIGHLTPHMLRRTSLTQINDSTRDLRAAQLFAGHARPETTARYTTVNEDRMRDAAAALSWVS